MRYLVLSDVHANREALEAVLEDAGAEGYDATLLLGDVVGYGADPEAVVARLRGLPGLVAVRGNHDRVAAGFDDGEEFNEAARAAILWTREHLSAEAAAFLRDLPRGPVPFGPGRILSHGSPLDEDQYLLEPAQARRCFDAVPFELAFFGHTHLPGVFAWDGSRAAWSAVRGAERAVMALLPTRRHLVNPGSVGQPRDRDARCGYALFDQDTMSVTLRRIPYPHAESRRRILEVGLPAWLGDRLLLGV
jgi:predicted phosphodiesterase